MKQIAVVAGLLDRIRRDRRAVTAMEYGLVASLVAVAIIASVTRIGTNLNATFSKISAAL
jgi:pilus assembly protein Flp/PilA